MKGSYKNKIVFALTSQALSSQTGNKLTADECYKKQFQKVRPLLLKDL